MHALEGSVRDGAGSTAGFGAPGDTFALGVADDAVGGVGTPDTEARKIGLGFSEKQMRQGGRRTRLWS